METRGEPDDSAVASRVVLTYRPVDRNPDGAVDDEWIRDELESDTYRTYLRRARGGPVTVGEEWEEFVSCGCATPQDVVLRVTAVEGGEGLGADTAIDFRRADGNGT